MTDQNPSDIISMLLENKKGQEEIKQLMLMYYKDILRKVMAKPVPKSSLFDDYKSKLSSGGYVAEKLEGKIRISDNTLVIEGDAENTLWTANAVLCLDEYHFDIDEPYVMFDIGLNLGITSLCKAKDKNCVKIYGFEPFTPTFRQAENNMRLNAQLSQKISIYNYGLGDVDKELDINYNPQRPGAMSSVQNRFPECDLVEKIQIKEAARVLEPLFDAHTQKIFLKIDCEGAEKEILPNLDQKGLLKRVDVIVMEWHFENPEWMINLLKKNGFIIFRSHEIPDKIGMIRAYRKN